MTTQGRAGQFWSEHLRKARLCLIRCNPSECLYWRGNDWGLTAWAGVVPSATFQTSDGRYVIIGGNGDSIYTRLMTAVGRADMGADNPRYQSNTDRCQHEKEIYEVRRSHALRWSLAPRGTWLLNWMHLRASLHCLSCATTHSGQVCTRQS